jgi:hypothetical protein
MSEKKPLVKLLPDLIVEEFHLPIYTGKVRITEEQAQASCRWVEIKIKQSVPSFCFSIDKSRNKGENDPIFPFFNPEKGGVCSKNDAFLVCQKKQQVYVFLIELKSGNPKAYLKQLRAAQVFFQFIIARIKLYYTCSHSLEKLHFRGLLFSSRYTLTKGATKREPVIFNDRNGLLVTEQDCNQTYHLQSFLD